MPDEYDAFGRKKDDPAGLGDLGWGASSSGTPAQPQPQPVTPTQATPVPSPPPQPFQTITPVNVTRTGRNPAIVLVQVAVIAVIIGAVALAVTAGHSANKAARATLNGFNKTITVPNSGGGSKHAKKDKGDTRVPKQVASTSFFTASGLRSGLKILAKEQPGKISNFSFRKDRIDVQVIRGGKTHIVELQQGAEVPQEFSTSTAISGTDTLSYEELNPGAPARLMRAANSRLNASPSQVDYFVADKFSGALTWGVYYKNGKIAQGDSRGRYSRRIS